MPAKSKDSMQGRRFCNKAYGSVTQSAANTLTFSEIETNVDVFSKVAWVLQRIEYYFAWASLVLLVTSADLFELALTSSNNITDLGLANASVVDKYCIMRNDCGTAGNAVFHEFPLIRDFSNLMGGGLIIAPRPLYIALDSDSIAAAGTAQMRFYFERVELNADEYLELIDYYRIVS